VYFHAALPKALEKQFTVFWVRYKIQLTTVWKCLNKVTSIAVAEMEDVTAKNTILLEKLIVFRLVEKFSELYGARRSLPHTQKPTPHHLISFRSILLSPFHQLLGLPSIFIPSGFPVETLYASLFQHCVLHVPSISSSLISSTE